MPKRQIKLPAARKGKGALGRFEIATARFALSSLIVVTTNALLGQVLSFLPLQLASQSTCRTILASQICNEMV